MVLDSLRYWAREMRVDGFRFDLASVFARRSDGSLDYKDPPIFGDIASDPDLAGLRLIAEPWDAAGVYQLGRAFPGVSWAQWNGRFRDDVRRFVRGDARMVPSLMRRLYGSDDLFRTTARARTMRTRASTTSPRTTASRWRTFSRTKPSATRRMDTGTQTGRMKI